MNRRAFLGTLSLATLAGPHVVRGQAAQKLHRIGIIGLAPTFELVGPQPRSPSTTALMLGLRELGYVYGQHYVTEARGGGGRPERFASLAAELVRLPADVIVAAGPALNALTQATSTIPIVMAASNDPVAQGYAESLAHPGRNVTGLSLQSAEASGKQLELIKELVPGSAPVAVLWNRSTIRNWEAVESGARVRGWKLMSLEVGHDVDIARAIKAAADARAGALLVYASNLVFPRPSRVPELVASRRLPAMYELRPYVEAGGLISYGADVIDMWRRAATFVDRILKGAKPADLPIEQPTKFELVINLRTSRALALAVPPPLLLRADHVIE